jgi:hypothetical protein
MPDGFEKPAWSCVFGLPGGQRWLVVLSVVDHEMRGFRHHQLHLVLGTYGMRNINSKHDILRAYCLKIEFKRALRRLFGYRRLSVWRGRLDYDNTTTNATHLIGCSINHFQSAMHQRIYGGSPPLRNED